MNLDLAKTLHELKTIPSGFSGLTNSKNNVFAGILFDSPLEESHTTRLKSCYLTRATSTGARVNSLHYCCKMTSAAVCTFSPSVFYQETVTWAYLLIQRIQLQFWVTRDHKHILQTEPQKPNTTGNMVKRSDQVIVTQACVSLDLYISVSVSGNLKETVSSFKIHANWNELQQ